MAIVHLVGFASSIERKLLAAIRRVEKKSPFRHMITPGGHAMSAAMTNCGPLGWYTDRSGYRYESTDPLTGKPWPKMPKLFLDLAENAACAAGFPGFHPDACLVNRYAPGAKMGLHRDADEIDDSAPIVSVSLGLSAVFLFGGASRKDPVQKMPLVSGDVVVWGGLERKHYHGILPIKEGNHPSAGGFRFNLTLRKAG